MGIEIGGPYEVGGLEFEMTKHDKWPYRVLREYRHSWRKKPRNWNGQTEICDSDGVRVAALREDGVTLLEGYAWNGSNVVKDTMACMRASALHDLWCQAMTRGIFGNGYPRQH